MWIIYVVAAVIAIVLSYRYLRIFIKRMILAIRIKHTCRKEKLTFKKGHFLWALGLNRSRKCDFYIEDKSTVYVVKLFAAPKRVSHLYFTDDGKYFFNYFYGMKAGVGAAITHTHTTKTKALPDVDFGYDLSKPVRKILLVNPSSMDVIKKRSHGGDTSSGSHDDICGMELFSLSSFLGEVAE